MMRDRTTPDGARFERVLLRQMRTFVRQLDRARRGDAADVHRARVASRRLREMLPLVPGGARRAGADLTRDARRATRALGPVREVDVALAECGDQWTDSRAPAELIGAHLEDERAARVAAMRTRLDRIGRKALQSRVRTLVRACERLEPGAWRIALAARIRQRATRLCGALDRVGTLYAAEPMHEVRVAAKKLRYSLELAQNAAGVPVRADLTTLRRLQNLLGRIRDLEVMQGHVRIVIGDARDVAIVHALNDVHARLEMACRALHAEFVDGRDVWRRAADHAAHQIAAGLVDRRMARMKVPSISRPAGRRASA